MILGGVCAPQRARGQPTTAFLAGNARANASPRETIIGKVTPLVPAKRNWLPEGKKQWRALLLSFAEATALAEPPRIFSSNPVDLWRKCLLP